MLKQNIIGHDSPEELRDMYISAKENYLEHTDHKIPVDEIENKKLRMRAQLAGFFAGILGKEKNRLTYQSTLANTQSIYFLPQTVSP